MLRKKQQSQDGSCIGGAGDLSFWHQHWFSHISHRIHIGEAFSNHHWDHIFGLHGLVSGCTLSLLRTLGGLRGWRSKTWSQWLISMHISGHSSGHNTKQWAQFLFDNTNYEWIRVSLREMKRQMLVDFALSHDQCYFAWWLEGAELCGSPTVGSVIVGRIWASLVRDHVTWPLVYVLWVRKKTLRTVNVAGPVQSHISRICLDYFTQMGRMEHWKDIIYLRHPPDGPGGGLGSGGSGSHSAFSLVRAASLRIVRISLGQGFLLLYHR